MFEFLCVCFGFIFYLGWKGTALKSTMNTKFKLSIFHSQLTAVIISAYLFIVFLKYVSTVIKLHN